MKRLAVAALALLFTASVAQAQTLNLATGEDWENLDPAFAGGVQTGAMVAKLYDGLMRYDFESSEVIPNLAREVVVNDDATVFTFHLHEGVPFHDGSILTAHDVKYSFERVVDPATGGPLGWVCVDALIVGAADFAAGEADEISGIAVLDDLTVEITLEEPYAMLLYHLAMPAAHIVPQAVAEELGADFSNNPVGTGPFMLGDRVRDSSLDLVAFDDSSPAAPRSTACTTASSPTRSSAGRSSWPVTWTASASLTRSSTTSSTTRSTRTGSRPVLSSPPSTGR